MPFENTQAIAKPPRCLPGDLQTLPTYPWMFTSPMSAQERLRMCRSSCSTYGNVPLTHTPEVQTRRPYKYHWQFRDHSADGRVHPDFMDLRGGPVNLHNVVAYKPENAPFPDIFVGRKEPDNTAMAQKKKMDEQRMWAAWWDRFGERLHYQTPERK